MPQSKNNKTHKERLSKFKNKKQTMSNEQQQNLPPQIPANRSIPVWDPQTDIIVKGFEWEAIYNFIGSAQVAGQAAQAVMSRNMVAGNISMDFEKLNPATMQYEKMTAEEKAPMAEQFAEAVATARKLQAEQLAEQAKDTPIDGDTRNQIVTPSGEVASNVVAAEKGRIVTGDFTTPKSKKVKKAEQSAE